ncbi:50S ribosomal protein L23 [Limisalsivibrio acetivorans]|uniref:50S ribosomal protein L23 n=1 Tax=Limisalsivibrio acetivorans TaxID=1304888 RepID=UPI00047D33EC|nr:50S ribosomal protein L23 [Limisalsivibrio acetivorans]
MTVYDVIKRPLVTEKAVSLKEDENKISFAVDPRANKQLIKQAVEKLFDVKVSSVSTMNFNGKKKRFGTRYGRRQDWKKAVITLAEGEKLEFV